MSQATSETKLLGRSPAVPLPTGAFGRLTVAELHRRLWHISPGFLPLILWFIPHQDPWGTPLRAAVYALAMILVPWMLFRFRDVARRGESGVTPVLGYAASVLGMLWLFPGREELGLTVLAVLAFGDGMATFGGKLLQGPALPWNRQKTWVGLLCFCGFGGVMSSIIYWGEARPQVTWSTAIACGLTTTLVSAVAESLPLRLNDNIRVGVTAGVVVTATHALLLGW